MAVREGRTAYACAARCGERKACGNFVLQDLPCEISTALRNTSGDVCSLAMVAWQMAASAPSAERYSGQPDPAVTDSCVATPGTEYEGRGKSACPEQRGRRVRRALVWRAEIDESTASAARVYDLVSSKDRPDRL